MQDPTESLSFSPVPVESENPGSSLTMLFPDF